MSAAAPIEDFLEAITAQLDRTQDSLRMKAVNRPLTFALKDFAIDLSVFVEMDVDGRIRLRPSGANETGASSIHIQFTTITRPMIEENTIDLELTQSPSLEEAGLAPNESQRLERLGVRNLAQLRRLQETSDEDSVSRFSGVDIGRLRQAMKVQPRINYIDIGPGRRVDNSPDSGSRPQLEIPEGQSRLRLRGDGLVDRSQRTEARFGGRALPIKALSESHMEIELPAQRTHGQLEIILPDGRSDVFDITPENFTGANLPAVPEGDKSPADSWSGQSGEEL